MYKGEYLIFHLQTTALFYDVIYILCSMLVTLFVCDAVLKLEWGQLVNCSPWVWCPLRPTGWMLTLETLHVSVYE